MRIYGKCSIRSGGRDPEKKNRFKHNCLSHPQVVALGWAATCVWFWISLHMYLVSKYWPPRLLPPKAPTIYGRIAYIYLGTQVFLSRDSSKCFGLWSPLFRDLISGHLPIAHSPTPRLQRTLISSQIHRPLLGGSTISPSQGLWIWLQGGMKAGGEGSWTK